MDKMMKKRSFWRYPSLGTILVSGALFFFILTAFAAITVATRVVEADEITPDNAGNFGFAKEEIKALRDASAKYIQPWSSNHKCDACSKDFQQAMLEKEKIWCERVRAKYTLTKGGKQQEEVHQNVKTTLKDKNGAEKDIFVEPQSGKLYSNLKNALEHHRGGVATDIEQESSVPPLRLSLSLSNQDGKKALYADKRDDLKVKGTVKYYATKPISGQDVEITVKRPDGSSVTEKVTTSEKGEYTLTDKDSCRGRIGKDVEVEAKTTVRVKDKPTDQEPTKEKTITNEETIKCLRDLQGQGCVPNESDGIPPNRPILVAVSPPDSYATAAFTYFNSYDGSVCLTYGPPCDNGPDEPGLVQFHLDCSYNPTPIGYEITTTPFWLEPYDCGNINVSFWDPPEGGIAGNTLECDVGYDSISDMAFINIVTAVGGIVELPADGSDPAARAAEGSASSAPPYATIAGAGAAAALALTAGAWYAKRRWLR